MLFPTPPEVTWLMKGILANALCLTNKRRLFFPGVLLPGIKGCARELTGKDDRRKGLLRVCARSKGHARQHVYIDASIRSPMCQNSVGSAILPADQAPHMWWGPRFPGLQGCVTRGQEVGLPSLSRSHRGIWEPQPTQYFSH